MEGNWSPDLPLLRTFLSHWVVTAPPTPSLSDLVILCIPGSLSQGGDFLRSSVSGGLGSGAHLQQHWLPRHPPSQLCSFAPSMLFSSLPSLVAAYWSSLGSVLRMPPPSICAPMPNLQLTAPHRTPLLSPTHLVTLHCPVLLFNNIFIS